MKYTFFVLNIFSFLTVFCQTGVFKPVSKIDEHIKEASAIECVGDASLFWTIEDAGNSNKVYGLDAKGTIARTLTLENVSNNDWEDLTSDCEGHLYVGDFGNNSKKRKTFSILKISNVRAVTNSTKVDVINFTLPKKVKSKDFEAFFLLNGNFYIFSKERKKGILLKVPNSLGNHEATRVSTFNLKGKDNKITSAAVSKDGKVVVLLNHDKLWQLTDFNGDDFFTGTIKKITLNHNSQKEGICFKDANTLLITDERKTSKDGNIYSYTF